MNRPVCHGTLTTVVPTLRPRRDDASPRSMTLRLIRTRQGSLVARER